MNNNDLLNALSGIDPKYIDEAALELHAKQPENQSDHPVSSVSESPTADISASAYHPDGSSATTGIATSDRIRIDKKLRARRIVSIVLPTAAAILLTITVAYPFPVRKNTSDSASTAPAESANYSASEEAAADNAYYDAESLADTAGAYEGAEAVSDSVPAYESSVAASDTAPAYESAEAASDTAPAYEAEEPSADAASASEYAEADISSASGNAQAESAVKPEAASSESDATGSNASAGSTSAKDSDSSSAFGLEKAEYTAGILAVQLTGTIPDNTKEIEYTITGTGENGSEKIYAKGKLSDILTETDPLTLDISGSALPAGTYTLSIGEETIDFTV